MESENKKKSKRQLFVSYSNEDRVVARSIAEELRRHDVHVWFNEFALAPGDSIAARMQEVISSSDYLLILLSPHSVKSPWIPYELGAAYARELSDRNVTVIPVLISDCEIPAFLASRILVDLRKDFQQGIEALVHRLNLATDIDFAKLTPRQFEELVAELLSETGFSDVETGKIAEDKGVDILAKHTSTDPFGAARDETWFVEVKFYKDSRPDLKEPSAVYGRACNAVPEMPRGIGNQ